MPEGAGEDGSRVHMPATVEPVYMPRFLLARYRRPATPALQRRSSGPIRSWSHPPAVDPKPLDLPRENTKPARRHLRRGAAPHLQLLPGAGLRADGAADSSPRLPLSVLPAADRRARHNFVRAGNPAVDETPWAAARAGGPRAAHANCRPRTTSSCAAPDPYRCQCDLEQAILVLKTLVKARTRQAGRFRQHIDRRSRVSVTPEMYRSCASSGSTSTWALDRHFRTCRPACRHPQPSA
ncbi:hypothetical protein QFZ47_000653 [Variovorax paradoxus]|nr:hypothetical protein [Variovorax paradoxus]